MTNFADAPITPELIKAVIPAEIVRRLIIAVDADKTATRLDMSVSPATKAAILAVFAAGGNVSLCTGRAYAPATHLVLPIFPESAIHVLAGGATLMTQSGERLWGREIPGKLVAELVAQTEKLGCNFGFGLGKKFYVASDRSQTFHKFLPGLFLDDVRDIPDLVTQQIPILVISELNSAMKVVLEQHKSELSWKLMLDFKDEEYVDITAAGVTKVTGLAQLAKLKNLPVSEIITVGDGLNDLEMIQAGFGIAMGNAVPELKQLAKLTIGHTDNDGLAEFLLALIEARRQLS